MPNCQCCNEKCTLITSKFCEWCANQIIGYVEIENNQMLKSIMEMVIEQNKRW